MWAPIVVRIVWSAWSLPRFEVVHDLGERERSSAGSRHHAAGSIEPGTTRALVGCDRNQDVDRSGGCDHGNRLKLRTSR